LSSYFNLKGEYENQKQTTTVPVMSEVQARKKAAAAEEVKPDLENSGPPKLKAMDIKKMNGDALKDCLRERGLDVQGQKKDLMKRLMDYEAARS
jgi:hypothetical protein